MSSALDQILAPTAPPTPPAPPMAQLLPLEARLALQSAASIPHPFERIKGIDRAARRIRLTYPHLFRSI